MIEHRLLTVQLGLLLPIAPLGITHPGLGPGPGTQPPRSVGLSSDVGRPIPADDDPHNQPPTVVISTFGPKSVVDKQTLISLGSVSPSASGQYWAMRATTEDSEVVLIGGPDMVSIPILAGQTEIVDGRLVESLPETRISVNDSGQYAAVVNLTGDVFSDDALVLSASDGAFDVRVQEPQDIGPIDSFFRGGAGWAPQITTEGEVGYFWQIRYSNTGQPAGYVLFAPGDFFGDPELIAYTTFNGITRNLINGPFNICDFDRMSLTDDGLSWLLTETFYRSPSDQTGIRRAVKGVYGTEPAVILVEGQRAPGLGIVPRRFVANLEPTGALSTVFPDRAGRQDILVAQSGQPVPGGADGEIYASPEPGIRAGAFFQNVGDRAGDWITGALTRSEKESMSLDAAWVLNGERVIARSSEPVDIDGDGIGDDAYISVDALQDPERLVVAQGFLSDAGTLYVQALLETREGQLLGEALVRFAVPTDRRSSHDLNGDGVVNAADVTLLIRAIEASDPRGDIDKNGSTDASDIIHYIQTTIRGPSR